VIEASHTDRQSTLVVRSGTPIYDPAWTVESIGLEDLVLAYMRLAEESGKSDGARPTRLGVVA
jgi:ABC-2 type transport system ATP-binding protein